MTSKTNRLFADSSVLYSAITSRTGGARELLRWHLQNKVELVVSNYVLLEVERNLNQKAPIQGRHFLKIVDLAQFTLAEPTKATILAAAAYVELKDAPIIAVAQQSYCSILLTFDRKHLIDPPEVAEQSGLGIMTPGAFLQNYRGE